MEKKKKAQGIRTKQNLFEKSKNEIRGITLIALVITIIVLLILAAVSISTLTGDNGILNKANQAKEETERASEDEQKKMAMYEATMNTENTKFQGVTIPAGFAPTRIPGESTVDEGLVIIDSEGNEFVWIPVENKEDFKRIRGYRDDNHDDKPELQVLPSKSGEANETGENTNGILETETTQREAKEMYASVEKYKGFYVGRYEAGIENGILKQDEGGKNYWEKGKVVVKKGATVYNYIGWNNLEENNITADTGGAVQKAREFKEGKEWKNSATSTLIYGVQWDATMQFLDEKYKEMNCAEDSYVRNSKGKGWYIDNYEKLNPDHKTGIDLPNNENKVKNIYDLGGNVWEWTMECFDLNMRVSRGGFYNVDGKVNPASNRCSNSPNNHFENDGFRIALYISSNGK